MPRVKRKTALAALPAAAALAGAVLAVAAWAGWPSPTGAASPAAPAPCVAIVLPDTYYQAIAELNACTGMGVAVQIPPTDIPWAIAGELPGSDIRVIVDP